MRLTQTCRQLDVWREEKEHRKKNQTNAVWSKLYIDKLMAKIWLRFCKIKERQANNELKQSVVLPTDLKWLLFYDAVE